MHAACLIDAFFMSRNSKVRMSTLVNSPMHTHSRGPRTVCAVAGATVFEMMGMLRHLGSRLYKPQGYNKTRMCV